MLIPNQDVLQEQSNKEIAPTKESARKGQRPPDSFRTDCSKWLHCSPFSGNANVYSILRLAKRPRASKSKCMSKLRAPNSVCLVLSNFASSAVFLGTWFFTNLPTKFRSWPVLLPDGMMVHHFQICKHHLSLWFYRRGARIYSVYTGLAKTNIIKQLEAAGGDHGFSNNKQFFQYQRYALQRVIKAASGHEPRNASGGNEPIKTCVQNA